MALTFGMTKSNPSQYLYQLSRDSFEEFVRCYAHKAKTVFCGIRSSYVKMSRQQIDDKNAEKKKERAGTTATGCQKESVL